MRKRGTSRRARRVDRFSTLVITLGGVGVIACVLAIFVYLAWVVRPLFRGATIEKRASYPLLPRQQLADLLFAEVDEYGLLGLYLLRSGEAAAFAARTGEVVARHRLFPPENALTAWSRVPRNGRLALGFADGSVRVARLAFSTTFLAAEGTQGLEEGGAATVRVVDGGVVERTPGGELRRVALEVELEEPVAVGRPGVAVTLLDYRSSEGLTQIAALKADGQLLVNGLSERENMLTGETVRELHSLPVPVPGPLADLGQPRFLLVTTKGDQLLLAWADGTAVRYDLRDPAAPRPVERASLTAGGAEELTVLRFMLGEQSLLAGDSTGGVRAWFLVDREHAPPGEEPTVPRAGWVPEERDHDVLVPAHSFPPLDAAVRAIATSARDKSFLAGSADGGLALFHMASEQELGRARAPAGTGIVSALIAPKGDGLFAVATDGSATLWRLENPHPETTLSSLFGKAWYEGAPEPSYTWQSSSGTDDFEPKLSLVPLVFGSLKATLYSLLFALPVALGAAIYSAEFLDRRHRTPIKSAIEVMAALPSVVLGFVAALVLAPIVETWALAVLAAFALAPLAALAAGHVWQLLPTRLALAPGGRPQLLLILLVVAAALYASPAVGGFAERLLFAGDFKGWLDGRSGRAAPGIAALLWPPLLVALFVADRWLLAPRLGQRAAGRSRLRSAHLDLLRLALLLVLSLAAAWAAGVAGESLELDARGPLLGTYVQRNALVVGFVMGFAVIPIIYTIADDALIAVPQSLRSASLACGATRWQTATRVVLPVAVPGIFSAVMIGFGRAVGETMIVLMAAGNTPVMELNPFSGLRTLSANIAVELPEAVKDSTLYRVLFLAALTLFVLTFAVNTAAELVRQRFRRRARQL